MTINPESLVNLSLIESIRNKYPNTFYTDHFCLLMLSFLSEEKQEIKSTEIQRLFLEKLLMDIPLMSINSIAKRAVRKGFFEEVQNRSDQQQDKIFILNQLKIQEKNKTFIRLKDEIKHSQERFYSELQKYISTKYNINLQLDKCKMLFYTHFLKHYKNIYNTNTPESRELYNEDYVVNDFIFSLYQNKNNELLKYLEKIIRGHWVLNYLIMWKRDAHKKSNLKGVTVFIDTPLIISLLGFHGELSKKIIIELVDLLGRLGAKIRVFSHNIKETQLVLNTWAGAVRNNNYKYIRTEAIKEIRSQSYDSQRLKNIATALKGFLHDLNIKESNDPTIPNQYRIDEQTFEEAISHPDSQYIGNKVHIDIKSAQFIFALRKGNATLNITDNPYIFVSSTYTVVNNVNKFFKNHYSESNNKNIPIFTTQDWLTNLCWLSSPKDTQLAKNLLISNAYATLNADSKFWEMFNQKLETTECQNIFTEQGIDDIRYEQDLKWCVEEHFVSHQNINTQDVQPIIYKTREKIYKHYNETIKSLDNKNKQSEKNIQKLAQYLSKIIIYIIIFVVIIIIIGISKYLSTFLGIILSVIGIVIGFLDIKYKKIKNNLYKKIFNFLKKMILK